jgi:hypothetical protein
MAMEKIGRNVMAGVKNNHLIIDIDLSKKGVASKSDKSTNIATTGGNRRLTDFDIDLPGELGLNYYIRNKDIKD